MKKVCLIALLIFLMAKWYISLNTLARETIRTTRADTNEIYRCCENKCYVLESYANQIPVKEVSRKEIYDNYNETTIIFSSRYCPKL